ncbi:MAG: DUF3971 domain-containing protein [Roseobacter sp.]
MPALRQGLIQCTGSISACRKLGFGSILQEEAPSPTKARFRRRRKRTLFLTLIIFAVLISGAMSSAFWLRGRDLVAPEWLRDEVEQRLANFFPDVVIQFDDVVASIGEDWRPRFYVRNLDVRTLAGLSVVSVSDISAGLDRTALTKGRISLSSLQANGVLVSMRRSVDGAISLTAGARSDGASRQAPNLTKLVDEMDDLLLRPALASLQNVDVRTITLRYDDLRAERAWTVDGGRMRLERNDSDLQIAVDLAILGGQSNVATVAANYSGVIGENASQFGISIDNLDARDIASQGAAFSWLGALAAPISGSLRGGVREDDTLEPLNATLQIGAGVIQPTPQTSPIPIDGARSYFSFYPKEQLLRFDELSVASQWGRGRLEGQAILGRVAEGKISDLVGQFRVTDLAVNPDDLYPEPVKLEAAELDFRLKLNPFILKVGRLQVTDAGSTVISQGSVSGGRSGWNVAMDAEVDTLSAPRLMALWPTRLKEKTRTWISENIRAGTVNGASASVRIAQGGKPETYLGFNFQDAEFTFTKDLPPVKKAKGHASLFRNRFVLILDDGEVTAPQGGAVSAAGTSFIVPATDAKPAPPGIVRLNASGSITAALSLLDQPPLEVMQKAKLPVSIAQGRVDVAGTLSLPLKKKIDVDEVQFDVRGTVSDVRSDVLIKDRVLAAPRLTLEASEKGVRVAGLGTLDDVSLDVVWRQPLGRPGDSLPGQVTGTVEIDQAALTTFGVDLPPGVMNGATRGTLTLDLLKGVAPKLSLRSDLTGVSLGFAPLAWSKSSSREGLLELDMTLGDAPRVDRLVLEAGSLLTEGTVTLNADQQLDRVSLDRVRLGGWLDAPVDLVGRGQGNALGVEIRGGTVDLRKADFPSGETSSSGTQGGPITVALDRLQISDTISLTQMQGTLSTQSGISGSFSGRVNGGEPITGDITPQNGRSAVRVQADNAGRVFSSAGLVTQALGGQMELVLVPVGTGGAFDGKLSVLDAKVTEAPTIAGLLNAISGVGLINELNGDGIYFSEIKADFRLAPSRITLREASAVGASIGLSMDGVFQTGTGALQMQGVISPIYALNSIGSVLTRSGEGLFGFNYSITGSTKEPKVFVNPLTALAPGFLRNLFRRKAPTVPLEEGEPVPVPEPRRIPVVTRGEDR